jgi:hypothetical protein
VSAIEKHFSVPELAKLWALSQDTVRALFKDRPGVFKLAHQETRSKRGYVSLRIPQSVVAKVWAERAV